MYAYTRRSLIVTALLCSSLVLDAGARRLRRLAKTLRVRFARRRAARRAVRDLAAMSDLELKDIGMSRSDIPRVAWQPLRHRNTFRID
jgi:uncharacterized protein YjiS (DUF1127 family)